MYLADKVRYIFQSKAVRRIFEAKRDKGNRRMEKIT
jgi:hypothetical protein